MVRITLHFIKSKCLFQSAKQWQTVWTFNSVNINFYYYLYFKSFKVYFKDAS